MSNDKASQGDRCPVCGKNAVGTILDGRCGWCWRDKWTAEIDDLRRQLHASQQAVAQAEEENERLRHTIGTMLDATEAALLRSENERLRGIVEKLPKKPMAYLVWLPKGYECDYYIFTDYLSAQDIYDDLRDEARQGAHGSWEATAPLPLYDIREALPTGQAGAGLAQGGAVPTGRQAAKNDEENDDERHAE